MSKFMSRKFLLSLAAFLASLGTGIAGIAVAEPTIATVGIACTVLSGAIYAAAEAYVDGASAKANGTTKTIAATTDSASIVRSAIESNQQ